MSWRTTSPPVTSFVFWESGIVPSKKCSFVQMRNPTKENAYVPVTPFEGTGCKEIMSVIFASCFCPLCHLYAPLRRLHFKKAPQGLGDWILMCVGLQEAAFAPHPCGLCRFAPVVRRRSPTVGSPQLCQRRPRSASAATL